MKSIKTKLNLSFTILTGAALLVFAVAVYLFSVNSYNNFTTKQMETQIRNDSILLKMYCDNTFGKISLGDDNVLVDQNGQKISDKQDAVDAFAKNADINATIFRKDGNDFVRILTNIKNTDGTRAVGTKLDKDSAAYEELIKGNEYAGKNEILGGSYATHYTPITDDNNKVIGVYFVGVDLAPTHELIGSTMKSLISLLFVLFVVCELICIMRVLQESKRIIKPIMVTSKAAQQICDGNLDTSLDVKTNSKETKLLVDSISNMKEELGNYQLYIDEICTSLEKISNGQLNFNLELDYTGQFQQLHTSLEDLISSLKATMTDISTASEQVALGSEQVSNGAQALSQGTTEQASSIEELSSSISEVSDQITENAENSRVAKDKYNYAEETLISSNQQMQDMITAMEQISEKSNQISNIVKMIDDIAFQTNILSLNAAVEAARAGSAGKGFAVVADEVRNLASKSADAVKNTTKLIKDTIVAVENGSKIANETATSLENSKSVTQEAVELIDRIATASDQQAQSIQQINQGIEQISAVIQTNAATAEESAATSEEMSSQANMLKEAINKFQL